MNNDWSFIRHEVLNIITLVNFLLADAELEAKKKGEILAHLRMIALLIAKQEVLSGEKREFMKREVNIDEVLELLFLILEKETKRKKVHLSFLPANFTFLGESKVAKEGLEQILLNVMDLSKKIEIRGDEKKKLITIKYGSTKVIAMEKISPIEYLRQKRSYSEVFLRTAVYMMELNGIKTAFKKGLVEVVFPG